MVFEIEINNKKYQAKKGETILQALNHNGITVPTLCKLPNFSPTGACRLCVVEVEGKDKLVTACSYPVQEWMKIKTHSSRVIKSRRTIIELLLANHPDDCLYCIRNGNCELQDLAIELDIRERVYFAKKNDHKKDKSSAGIERDPAKCILCGRCVKVCEETMKVSAIDFVNRGKDIIIDTTFHKGLNLSTCINCGQCILVCPTGAIIERSHIPIVKDAINDPKKHVVAHFDPVVSVSLAEEFGLKPGKDASRILTAILKRLGFDAVFETALGADINILETVDELIHRKSENIEGPLFSTNCAAFVQFIEKFYPEFITNLSRVKSSQQIAGAISKSFYAEKVNIDAEQIFTVSIVACTSRKFEAQREEMNMNGLNEIDAVLTTRELMRFIKLFGIDVENMEPEFTDLPLSSRSSGGKLLGIPGGNSEALIRTLHFRLTHKDKRDHKILDARNVKEFKIFEIKIGKDKFKFAIVNGLGNLDEFIENMKLEGQDIDFVEVVACHGGCMNGGGQLFNCDEKQKKIFTKALYDMDDKDMIKVSYKNPSVRDIYKELLIEPLSAKSKQLLHISYPNQEVL